MACRRAFDVDLVACLLDRERPEWRDFRDHYPTCSECAAEVRTWTELHADLTSAHPEPERLLALEDRPALIPTDERDAMHEHVHDCPACRDEIITLRETDIPALVRAGTAVATPLPTAGSPRWHALRRPAAMLDHLGETLGHPAVAYGIAAALLMLAVAPQLGWRPGPDAQPPARTHPLATTKTTIGQTLLDLPDGLPETYDAQGMTLLSAAGAGTESLPVPPGWSRLVVTPDSSHVVAAGVPGLVLYFPLSPIATPAGLVELRIADAAGRRELREHYFGPPAHAIEMRVPGPWLRPGRYTVALYDGAGESTASARLDVNDGRS